MTIPNTRSLDPGSYWATASCFFQKLSESISHQNMLSAQRTEHCEAWLGGKKGVRQAWTYGIWNRIPTQHIDFLNILSAHYQIFEYSMCWSVAIDMFRFRCVVLCLCLKHNALFFLSCTIGRHQLYGCMWAGHDLTWLDKLGCQLLPAFQCYFHHLQPISCRLQNQSDHSTPPKGGKKISNLCHKTMS